MLHLVYFFLHKNRKHNAEVQSVIYLKLVCLFKIQLTSNKEKENRSFLFLRQVLNSLP